MYLSLSHAAFATATASASAVTSSFHPSPWMRAPFSSIQDSEAYTTMGGSQIEKWSSLIGIITAIIGNILISFALNIQRYAHIRLHNEVEEKKRRSRALRRRSNGYGTTTRSNKAKDSEDRDGRESPDSDDTLCPEAEHAEETSYLKSPYWWAGIALMTIGETGNFLAYGFAPASIVSPLGVVALVSNCVIAPIMLKERFRWRDFWGVVIAVGGAVTVVLSANQEEKRLGPHEVIGAITTLEFKIYMGVTAGLMVLLAWLSPRYGSRTILIDLGLVGLFGGYTALSTKGVASMLSSTLWKAFTTPVTYALIAVLAITAVMQVKYLNKALQRFDSTQVIPVQFVIFTISVIVGSAILYRDFESATAESVSKFVGGCLLTFFGVFLITSGRSREDDSESDDGADDGDDEGDERIGLHRQETYGSGVTRRRPNLNEGNDSHSTVSHSRRSSKVSFLVPSPGVRPETPQGSIATSSIPPVRLHVSPGRDETLPLLGNPWKEHTDELLSAVRAHPGLPATTSTPLLPTEAQALSYDDSSPTHPPLAPPFSRTNSQTDPQTHPNLQQPGPPQAELLGVQRPVTPRHSLSRSMLPGPYLSPLSSSLSAVVADTRRRNSNNKRPKMALRRSKSGSQYRLGQAQEDIDEYAVYGSPLKHTESASDRVGRGFGGWLAGAEPTPSYDGQQQERAGRARSLSNTLGDLLRGKRQRPESEDEETGADVGSYYTGHEAGPSEHGRG